MNKTWNGKGARPASDYRAEKRNATRSMGALTLKHARIRRGITRQAMDRLRELMRVTAHE